MGNKQRKRKKSLLAIKITNKKNVLQRYVNKARRAAEAQLQAAGTSESDFKHLGEFKIECVKRQPDDGQGPIGEHVAHIQIEYINTDNDANRYDTSDSARNEWLRVINREDLIDTSCLRARVCEVHFSPESIITNASRKLLKKNSIPELLAVPKNFENKGVQTIIETADANVQCDYNFQTNAQVQIPLHISNDTPRQRKLSSKIRRRQIRLKMKNNRQSEANMFLKLCDKFLTPKLARVVKQQTKMKTRRGYGNSHLRAPQHYSQPAMADTRHASPADCGSRSPSPSVTRGHADGPHSLTPHASDSDMAGTTSSSILRITDEKTMQLIDLYQKEVCLWNTTIEDYRNRTKRSEAAERIAKALDIKDFGPRHVLMKFKNLRNSFSQELKKIAGSQAIGDGCYTPSVFWFDKLNSFLRPYLQPPRGASHARVYRVDGTEEWMQLNHTEEVIPIEMAYSFGSDNEQPLLTQKRRTRNRPDYYSTSKSKRTKNSGADEQKTVSKRRQRKKMIISELRKEDEEKKKIAASLKDLSDKLNGFMSQQEDVYDTFGKYVAGLLRNLPPRKALQVQPQIIGLITAAGLDHLVVQVENEQNLDCETVVFKVEKE